MLSVPISIESFEDTKSFRELDLLDFKIQGKILKAHDRSSEKLIHKKTSVALSYRTNSYNSLSEYAVVQFIRGCLKNGDDYEKRDFWGNDQYAFNHPEWVIDSIDKNPIYKSFNESSHEGYYFFLAETKKHPLFNLNKEKVYFVNSNQDDSLDGKRLYVKDSPTGASIDLEYDNVLPTDVFLEFKSCIYRTIDIPKNLNDPSMTNIKARPLHCFFWESKHVWDSDQDDFITPKVSLKSFCS